MSKKKRRKWTPEQRAAILREHLVDKKPVSDVCDKHGIQPSLFYSWMRQLCDNMETALQDGRSNGNGVLERKIAKLEKQVAESDDLITDKQRVIAEVTEEYVKLKKTLGQS